MIRLLRLQNYKCFEDQRLDLNALTLLSGLNGTGKSSVIQSLLLLRQSYQQDLLRTMRLTPNAWRLYFYPLAKERKLSVGYIGSHLPIVLY